MLDDQTKKSYSQWIRTLSSPFRYHALRRYGASTLETAGVSISSIQRILCHENRTTTEIHLHSIGNPERVAMNAYDEVG